MKQSLPLPYQELLSTFHQPHCCKAAPASLKQYAFPTSEITLPLAEGLLLVPPFLPDGIVSFPPSVLQCHLFRDFLEIDSSPVHFIFNLSHRPPQLPAKPPLVYNFSC